MTKFYAIIPCFLLLGFLVFERDFSKGRAQRDAVRASERAIAQAAEEQKRAALREAAAEAVRVRAAEREKEERDRLAKKLGEHENALRQLEAEALINEVAVAALEADAAELQESIAATRAQQLQIAEEAFALSRAVEIGRIERRSADLEIQRATGIVVARLGESPLLQPTPAPKPN